MNNSKILLRKLLQQLKCHLILTRLCVWLLTRMTGVDMYLSVFHSLHWQIVNSLMCLSLNTKVILLSIHFVMTVMLVGNSETCLLDWMFLFGVFLTAQPKLSWDCLNNTVYVTMILHCGKIIMCLLVTSWLLPMLNVWSYSLAFRNMVAFQLCLCNWISLVLILCYIMLELHFTAG